MIKSIFNIYAENDVDCIIYNTLNMSKTKIPNFIYNKYIKTLPNMPSDLVKKLNLSDFYVKDVNEDLEKRRYLFNSMTYQNVRLNITLMMTFNCNFKCTYCFEQSFDKKKHSIDLRDDVFIDWLISLIKLYDIRVIDLCFHGGEPLLEIDKIEIIAKKLIDFFEKNKIFYMFSMVTNGYFLTKKNCEVLKKCKIKKVQVSIDGTKDIHDKRRMLKNDNGTFDVIFDNIKNLYGKSKLIINSLFDKENEDNIKELIDLFNMKDMNKYIDIFCANTTRHYANDTGYNKYLSSREEAEIQLRILKYIMDAGFYAPYWLNYKICTIRQKGSICITPELKGYKCINGVTMTEFYLCDIKEIDDMFSIKGKHVGQTLDSMCQKCMYSPICNGWCTYEHYVTGKRTCRKGFYNNFAKSYLRLIDDEKYMNLSLLDWDKDDWEREYSI